MWTAYVLLLLPIFAVTGKPLTGKTGPLRSSTKPTAKTGPATWVPGKTSGPSTEKQRPPSSPVSITSGFPSTPSRATPAPKKTQGPSKIRLTSRPRRKRQVLGSVDSPVMPIAGTQFVVPGTKTQPPYSTFWPFSTTFFPTIPTTSYLTPTFFPFSFTGTPTLDTTTNSVLTSHSTTLAPPITPVTTPSTQTGPSHRPTSSSMLTWRPSPAIAHAVVG